MPRILLIEDEPDLLELLRYNFEKAGYDVSCFSSGEPALEFLRRNPADLLIVDIMLPGQDGLDICRRVRSQENLRNIPLIFLTAKGDEVDRIIGLELGADDYVVKPFSTRELVARVKAVLRRRRTGDETRDLIRVRDLHIDASACEVTVAGKEVKLSSLEFRLLYWLASHPRQVFSREQLLGHVWGVNHFVTPRNIDVYIRRLREKIEMESGQPAYIETVRGFGYRFRPELQSDGG